MTREGGMRRRGAARRVYGYWVRVYDCIVRSCGGIQSVGMGRATVQGESREEERGVWGETRADSRRCCH